MSNIDCVAVRPYGSAFGAGCAGPDVSGISVSVNGTEVVEAAVSISGELI